MPVSVGEQRAHRLGRLRRGVVVVPAAKVPFLRQGVLQPAADAEHIVVILHTDGIEFGVGKAKLQLFELRPAEVIEVDLDGPALLEAVDAGHRQ